MLWSVHVRLSSRLLVTAASRQVLGSPCSNMLTSVMQHDEQPQLDTDKKGSLIKYVSRRFFIAFG